MKYVFTFSIGGSAPRTETFSGRNIGAARRALYAKYGSRYTTIITEARA